MFFVSQTVYSFLACFFFAIIQRAPRDELIYCGLTGSIGWLFYEVVTVPTGRPVVASFVASVAVTAASRFLSHIRRAPSTLYLIPGIIALVPGSGLYYTMYSMLTNDFMDSFAQGVYTLKIAGVIAVGIILVLSLPYSVFNFIQLKDS